MSDWTEIVCILDRSGSMGGLETDTIGGFNAFVKRQQAEAGRARLTLVLFDHEIETPWKHVELSNVAELDDKLYFVRGSTALLDAIGTTVGEVRGRLNQAHEKERPGQIIVLVMTDGYENASREYSGSRLTQLVKDTQAEGWEYVFIGAEIDAFGTAHNLAMAQGSSSPVSKTSAGMLEAYSKMNRAVSNLRRTGVKGDVDDALDDDDLV